MGRDVRSRYRSSGQSPGRDSRTGHAPAQIGHIVRPTLGQTLILTELGNDMLLTPGMLLLERSQRAEPRRPQIRIL
jgi:hypothetical protein